MTIIVVLLIGIAAGAGLGVLALRGRTAGLAAEARLLRERLAHADTTGRDAAGLGRAVAPLQATLDKVEVQLRELERARVSAYSALTEQVRNVGQTSVELREQTASLVGALRAPQARGRWGEMQLRRVVELAGMVEHCDFDEQATATTDDGIVRPDLVVRLAGGKQVVVDAKVSLAAYLTAAESRDDDVREERLRAHSRSLRTHVEQLAAKSYWRAFQPSPEFVVLFVPGEAFLAPALEHDPALLDDAMGRRVVIATPTTLVAMLRTVAFAWQQDALTANAREVFELGRELYRRLGTLGGHVDKLGRSLTRSVEDYNATVGSLERSVLVQARRMAELRVAEGELGRPTPLEAVPRPVASPELVGSAEVAREVRSLRDRPSA
jgi:DNA recombination protein RmuC